MLNDAAALNDAAFCMHAERRRCARRNLNNVVALRMLNDDAALHTWTSLVLRRILNSPQPWRPFLKLLYSALAASWTLGCPLAMRLRVVFDSVPVMVGRDRYCD
jgi:hypothetical protein